MKTNLQQTRALNYVVLKFSSFFEIKRSDDEMRKRDQNNLIRMNSKLTIKTLLICMMFFMYGTTSSWSQSTSIWSNPITGNDPSDDNPYTTGDVTSSYITVSGIGETGLTGRSGNNRYNVDGFSTSNNINTNSDYFSFTITPISGYHINFNSFDYSSTRQTGSRGGPREFAFRSSENGSNDIGNPDDNGATLSLTNSNHQNITSAIEFRFHGWDSQNSSGDFSIDDFDFTGGILGSATTNLSSFSACIGNVSEAQSFVVNGQGLSSSTATITIGGTTNYEVSITSALTGFSNNVTFNATGGSVSQTVWVRLKVSAPIGSHSEDITISGGGFSVANGIAINCSGAVNLLPSSITVDASSYSICENGSINLSASAISNSAIEAVVLLEEGFNAGTNSWSTINNSTGANAAATAWTLRPNDYAISYSNTNASSNDSSQFYFSDSDAGGSGSVTETYLQSPSFSTIGLSTVTLNFFQYFRSFDPPNEIVSVQASTDGLNWTTIESFTSSQGDVDNFDLETVSLNGFLEEATVYIRFRYFSAWGYYLAIDNVTVSGLPSLSPAPSYSWTSTPAGFLSAEQNPTNVMPASNTTYTVTVTNSFGCSASATTAMVEVVPNVTYYADADNDGFGDDEVTIQNCIQIEGYVLVGGDCDDTDNTIFPGATEICYDGILQNCIGSITDGCEAITSRLRTENCNSTLISLNQVVRGNLYSQSIPNGVDVTGYRFRVTNLITSEQRIVERSNYIFQLTYTDFADYNTPYSVEVALRLNQEWIETYGSPCIITTPEVPNTVLTSTSCGTTLAQMNNIIRAVVVPSALNYEYNVALIEGGFPVETTTLVRPGESFNLLQLSGISLKFASEYSVTIRVEVPTSSGPQWSTVPGAACSVFTPAAPEASIEGCGGEAGIAPANMNTVVYASSVGGATQYQFTLTDGMGYAQVFTTPSRYFRLSNFNSLAALTTGGTYSVLVEVEIYGNFYPGKDCTIVVPGTLGRTVNPITRTSIEVDAISDDFKAIAYPNPFANTFAIDVRSNNTSEVSLSIYDMTGRLLETKSIKADGFSNQTIGERYPSGIYNVIVNQGENTQMIRIVKQ